MTQIKIALDSTLTQAQLDEVAKKLTNLKPVFSSIGEYMLGQTRDRFDRETSPNGNAWAPLTQATIESKARRQKSGSNRKGGSRARSNAAPNAILKDSFLLRDTINYRPTDRTVAIGTSQKYGVYHQYGTARMPARPFLGYNDADLAEIREIVIDAIEIL